MIGVGSIGEDFTEQKRAEIRSKRLTRVYAVRSRIKALIVRVRDRTELFRETCRIAGEAGAFRMAWIGVIDSRTLDGSVGHPPARCRHGCLASELKSSDLAICDRSPELGRKDDLFVIRIAVRHGSSIQRYSSSAAGMPAVTSCDRSP